MKKLIFYIFLFCAPTLFAQNREWHVKPLGGGGNIPGVNADGSSSKPWDLQSALNNPGGVIHGGDIIWLHKGNTVQYENYVGRFTCSLVGDAINYITISSYPGEWAILDGNAPNTTFYTDPQPNLCPIANARLEEYENAIYNADTTYTDDDEAEPDPVLSVTGGYLTFKDFQVCFTGNYNRRLVESNPTAFPFQKVTGINHSPDAANAGKKSKFINLIIKNVPGTGLGSWKNAGNSEIYGCIIYNNGYVWFRDSAHGNKVFGKGPGIYTQNNSLDVNNPRLVQNNIVHNNYDSGILVWSFEPLPTTDYINNYELRDNVIFNNANPAREHVLNNTSTNSDARPGLVIDSGTGNTSNRPKNVSVHNNFFYLNTTNYIGAMRVNKTDNVNIHDNFLSKGTKTCSFTVDNTNLTFTNNLYWGKYLEFGANASSYTSANANWNFNNNQYYIYKDSKNLMCHIPTSTSNSTQIRVPFTQFRLIYPTAETSEIYRDINFGGSYMYWTIGNTLPYFDTKIKVVQNSYNRNLFYVTVFNARGYTFSSVPINFSTYNIPNNTPYVIKDVENYANSTINGIFDINNPSINFDLNLPGTERPNGYYEDISCYMFTKYVDFATYTIEFKKCENVAYENTVSNLTETTTSNISAKGHVYLGTNYITNTTSNVTVIAGKSIQISGTDFFQPGSNVLLKIEDPCPDLAYVGDINSKMNTTTTDIKAIKEVKTADNLVAYPNPNSGIFKVESGKGLKIQQIIASDINKARVVFDQKYHNEVSVEVDISSKPPGIYVIDVFFEDGSKETQKIIKK